MELRTCKYINKHGIVLSAKDVPYDATLVFNAGVCKHDGKYTMIFRNDYARTGTRDLIGTNLGIAYSGDGVKWEVADKPFLTMDMYSHDKELIRIYDPRITVIDGTMYLCFAADTHHGLRGGVGVIDREKLEILSMSAPDNRNMVLFPEKIDGLYVRLERPFPIYSRGRKDRFDIWISRSPDLRYWGDTELLIAVEDIPYANDKIGPGAPPVKTDKGWLITTHAVDIDDTRGKNGWEDTWKKRYTSGLALLDLDNPSKVAGLYNKPLIVPEEDYETKEGFRTNVVFPGGMILEPDGEVKIYYGAADTVECLATATLDNLLSLF